MPVGQEGGEGNKPPPTLPQEPPGGLLALLSVYPWEEWAVVLCCRLWQ